MLRDNTETFAPELSRILSQFGIESTTENEYQLLKFERIEPDVFVWMFAGAEGSYILTLADGGSNHPDRNWLSTWAKGLAKEDLEYIEANEKIIDGHDSVLLYRLPVDYDYLDWVNSSDKPAWYLKTSEEYSDE